MKKVLVFQHVPYEILGTLDPLLRAAGYRIRYVNFGREPDAEPDIEKYQGLVVLGGPMNVDMVEKYPHLKTEVRLIKRAMEQGIPILGICLGAQLIAKTLGAKVSKNPEKEIGWYDISLTDAGKDDPLMRHLEGTRSIFEWHSDTFGLPEGAVHLASGTSCVNQAFRYGDNVYGFQFHMEVDQPLVERWLNTPVYQAEIAQTDGKIVPDRIREQTQEKIGDLNKLSTEVFGEFLNLMGRRKRFTRLGSM
ncbi:MAG: C26 family cysteine hydrolase domain-containing family [Deltaproteobacteria bacterium]|jgi:GMP synthase (glutamine-hydrolysing)|nr:C26 family cysteine hydrolase domain-containing family [Deltaproteobacteria bacterium]MBT6432902.1 C26 family cysteine hydrolase domain-containing family [Deltaproteobacteria bacterium]MBT6492104.1 C26 family cysteine hydrolase domain-containing family [Deltaproteobacteria bacterium]